MVTYLSTEDRFYLHLVLLSVVVLSEGGRCIQITYLKVQYVNQIHPKNKTGPAIHWSNR